MISFVCVDEDGREFICDIYPRRVYRDNVVEGIGYWDVNEFESEQMVELPKGSIEKLIGYTITWDDEPVELAFS